MCCLCLDIQKGIIKTKEELLKRYYDPNYKEDYVHMFDVLYLLNEPIKEERFDCSCGSKHTSFPTKHMIYCDLFKKE